MNKKDFKIILITVLCTLIVTFTILSIIKKPVSKEPLPIDKPPTNSKNKVVPFYEIKNKYSDGSNKIYKRLYINGVETDARIDNVDFDEVKNIFKIDDILLLSDSGMLYFYNKDAQQIENVKLVNDEKEYYYQVTKVVDKDIYYTRTIINHFCDYLNKVYVYEEKITYLGNQEFSSPELISTKTGNDYKKENQYICSLKELNKKNIRPIKKVEELNLLDYQEHKVLLNNKEVTIKQIKDLFDYQTYEINGELFRTYADFAYVTDQYILLMGGEPCGSQIWHYVDENGKVKDYVSDYHDIAFKSFKIKNNQLTASLVIDCLCETGYYGDSKKCNPYKKAVLYYDGQNMKLG